MRTDDLITALAADPRPGPGLGWALPAAILGPLALAAAAFLPAVGVRGDLAAALVAVPTLWKWLLPAAAALLGAGLARRLARPDAAGGAGLLLLPAAAAGLLLLSALAALPPGRWPAEVLGHTAGFCLAAILGLGLPPLAAGFLVLRRGATTRPRLAGLALGLAAGGAAAAVYALHCTEDAPLFFLTWYGAGILALGGIGAALGPRLLRW